MQSVILTVGKLLKGTILEVGLGLSSVRRALKGPQTSPFLAECRILHLFPGWRWVLAVFAKNTGSTPVKERPPGNHSFHHGRVLMCS